MASPLTPPFNLLHHPLSSSISSFSLYTYILLLPPPILSTSFIFVMKFTSNIYPKNLFRSKKSRSVTRSEPSSFSTTSSDSPESSHHNRQTKSSGLTTPTSVLPAHSHEISSDECSVMSADVQFELVQAFRIIDSDGDGRITRAELEALLIRLGGSEPPSQEELSLMLNEIDVDGDGSINLEEFAAISSAFGPPPCNDEIRGAFEFFDTDHDGRITADELLAVFKSIGDERCTLEDCRRMISSVDINCDGFVCFEDFTRMMEQQR